MSTHSRYRIHTLAHCFWDCQYHIVWTPKYRGQVFQTDYVKHEVAIVIRRMICDWKHYDVLELSVQTDHVHLVLAIDPRHSISYAVSQVKGKSSYWVKKKNKKFSGLCERGSLWARGYFVSTIGLNDYVIKRYVKHQDAHHELPPPDLWSSIDGQPARPA